LPRDPGPEFVFDPQLVSTTTDEFRWQIRFLKRHFRPISIDRVVAAIQGNDELPGNSVVITFDDGYDDNFHQAFPVLAELGVPATFFISTGYTGKDEPFWYDWLSAIIVGLDSEYLEVESIARKVRMPGEVGARRAVYASIVQKLKLLPNGDRLKTLEELKSRYGHVYENLGHDVRSLSRPMTSGQLREMAENGMQFGSHTVSHPILARLTDEELKCELSESRTKLRDWTGQEVKTLAYPNGGLADFSEKVVIAARAAGYELGMAYVAGENYVDKLEPFALRRMPVDLDTDRSLFELGLAVSGVID